MARKRTPPDLAASRARLLRVATDLFAKQGYQATSIDQIVATAGYTRGALYWHFAGKQELFLAVYEHAVEQMTSTILSRVAGVASPRERIERAIVAVLEESVLHHRVAVLQQAYVQEFGKTSGRRSKVLEEQFRTFETELTKLVGAGIKRGQFRDVEPRLAATVIVGAVRAAATAMVENPSAFAGMPIPAATAELCLRALGA
ncbi:MAG: TetR/AcrR family transcriptional regulator [bacterium]